MQAARTQASARELRADQAARVARELDDLSGGLNRFTTSSAQLEENAERLARMKQMESESRKLAADLGQSLIRIQWEKDGIEIALERNQAQLKVAATEPSPLFHYAKQAWDSVGKIILVGAAILMMVPSVWRLARPR